MNAEAAICTVPNLIRLAFPQLSDILSTSMAKHQQLSITPATPIAVFQHWFDIKMLQPRIRLCTQSLNFHPSVLLIRNYATTMESAVSSSSSIPPPIPFSSTEISATKDTSGDQYIRSVKPRTPGLRHLRQIVTPYLWKGRPIKALTFPKKGQSRGGRNNSGQVTVRHHGGGHKTRIRMVDFNRWEAGEQTVDRIEYDPGRSAHIALLNHTKTGKKSYIVASSDMRAGQVVHSYRAGIPASLMKAMGGKIDAGMLASQICKNGNCLPVRLIPPGTQIYNVGSYGKRGAVFCRSAGTYATVVGKEEAIGKLFKYMIVKLKSGETRRVDKDACATIGVASNGLWQMRQLGKAGRSRWLGIRPAVRGLAMNAGKSYRLMILVRC